MISKGTIDEVLEKTDIVTVIQERIQLKKAGNNLTACCPFHSEKTPSFNVSPDKQYYNCFGCGANGNAISFVMEYDRITFPEAVAELGDICGIQVNQNAGPADQAKTELAKKIHRLNKKVASLYIEQVNDSALAKDYLEERGFQTSTLTEFNIGYAPNKWDFVTSTLTPDETAIALAGDLIKESEGRKYDTFRNRIMFPIHSRKGDIVGFSGRALDPDTPNKYLNTKETLTFKKSELLFGLHHTLARYKRPPRMLLVEGQPDVLRLHESGLRYAVAPMGTAISHLQIKQIQRLTKSVLYCCDGDQAGRRAMIKVVKEIANVIDDRCEHLFIQLPESHDPDSFIKEFGTEAFINLLQQPMQLSEFVVSVLFKSVDSFSDAEFSQAGNQAADIVKAFGNHPLSAKISTEVKAKSGIDIHTTPSTPAATSKHSTESQSPVRVLLGCLTVNPTEIEASQAVLRAIHARSEEARPYVDFLIANRDAPNLSYLSSSVPENIRYQFQFLCEIGLSEEYRNSNPGELVTAASKAIVEHVLISAANELIEKVKEGKATPEDKCHLNEILIGINSK